LVFDVELTDIKKPKPGSVVAPMPGMAAPTAPTAPATK
jgi:hypothetical protein